MSKIEQEEIRSTSHRNSKQVLTALLGIVMIWGEVTFIPMTGRTSHGRVGQWLVIVLRAEEELFFLVISKAKQPDKNGPQNKNIPNSKHCSAFLETDIKQQK
ncbi:hypothetical protein AVEN_116449-1 [Araneus ventricosus]|uniref:Uncharacterized protein n=1 Tax=Araneus ventricosus TaxID=182803 RepID=A0A4Y2L0K8_ARAVE|nr:hypothetical protein AVEN_116449-1 [Araneus ventricosus]